MSPQTCLFELLTRAICISRQFEEGQSKFFTLATIFQRLLALYYIAIDRKKCIVTRFWAQKYSEPNISFLFAKENLFLSSTRENRLKNDLLFLPETSDTRDPITDAVQNELLNSELMDSINYRRFAPLHRRPTDCPSNWRTVIGFYLAFEVSLQHVCMCVCGMWCCVSVSV